MDHYEILNTKVVIKQTYLRGSERPDDLQRVATVYVNGKEYRVFAPPEAAGDVVDWVPHLWVRTPDGINSEIGVRKDTSEYVLEMLKQELLKNPPRETQLTSSNESVEKQIQVFISHSGADAEIAEELIRLLRLAIPGLGPEVIRCTSVSGYRLEGGAKTDDQIPKELLGAKVFIGLLSANSLRSTYVLFELGARWGARQHLLPLAVAGMSPSEFKAPLSGLNAHSAGREPDLFQLVEEVAVRLSLSLARPTVYAGQIKKLVQISEAHAKERDEALSVTLPQPAPKLSIPEPVAEVASMAHKDLLADLISELQDNLDMARAPRVGDAYRPPSIDFWKSNRNKIKLQEPLRSDLINIYREIKDWHTIVESGVHPNYGSPALDNTTASLSGRLPSLIEELKKLR